MKIALVGYGKMGRIIEQVALSRGHDVVLKIDLDNAHDLVPEKLWQADVAIEFTGPHSAFANVMACLDAGTPVVCGSTGWLEQMPEAVQRCRERNGSLLYASNFSVGVNIFFEVNKRLAQLMAGHREYVVALKEIHHTQKKDAPSGTAITLAEQVISAIPSLDKWVNHPPEDPGELAILSERTDPAPGTHHVLYSSSIDDIEIIHTAHNRNGFALGAVVAAEYIQDRKGIYSMADVLGL
jgi:4-hydroxy-tetrahydrodipicolinate reductase